MSGIDFVFLPKQGYKYQISGWMKGENINANANIRLRIDFYKSNAPIYTRNKSYLEAEFTKYYAVSNSRNKPLYLGEFGTGKPTFENNKGGNQWVNDMVEICKQYNSYFTYHAYHEDSFGIYFGYDELPNQSNANTSLINLFKNKLQNY